LTVSTRDLCAASDGRLVAGRNRTMGPAEIDSRRVEPGQVFFCLRGERTDGHRYADAAVEAGARVVVIERGNRHTVADGVFESGASVLEVPSAVAALQRYGALCRARYAGLVVGITGSSGKTTTKELLAAALGVKGETLRTPGNWNNHLGVPLTLSRLSASQHAAVIEMGMNAPGEIDVLAWLSQPTIGVVTSVGAAHLEGVGSLDAVARAKGELLRGLPPNGVAVLPSGINRSWVLTRGVRRPIVWVGHRPSDSVRLISAEETATGAVGRIAVGGARHTLRLRMPGRHNLDNALLAIAVARLAGIAPRDAIRALSRVAPAPMRGELRALPDGGRVLLDCYNSNPQSAAAAIDTFVALTGGEGVVVSGDMLELGAAAPAAHHALGQRIGGFPGLSLIGVGPLSAQTVNGARAAGLARERTWAVPDADTAAETLVRARRDGEWVLLKGSRGIGLERVWSALRAGMEA
jgi:UDP-N-acetylmuramoyl-tripeptide--D-alanyl-D-alanine ligase